MKKGCINYSLYKIYATKSNLGSYKVLPNSIISGILKQYWSLVGRQASLNKAVIYALAKRFSL